MHQPVRSIITDSGYRIHMTPLENNTAQYCSPHGWCRLCENERKEPYMSDDTKTKIRSVLKEHLGPSQAEIGDQERLVGKAIEWVNVAVAIETEFDIQISELAMEKCGTIDMIARLIDTIVASKHASPN